MDQKLEVGCTRRGCDGEDACFAFYLAEKTAVDDVARELDKLAGCFVGVVEADGGDVEGDLDVLLCYVDGEDGDYGCDEMSVIGVGVVCGVGAVFAWGGWATLSACGGMEGGEGVWMGGFEGRERGLERGGDGRREKGCDGEGRTGREREWGSDERHGGGECVGC